MIAAGEFADTLRALGRFLERTGATAIEIVDRGDEWFVASTLGSETLFETVRLEHLRKEAMLARGNTKPETAHDLSQILRILGQILDTEKATGFTICQIGTGFKLTTSSDSGDVDHTYSLDEIHAIAVEHRRSRQPPPIAGG